MVLGLEAPVSRSTYPLSLVPIGETVDSMTDPSQAEQGYRQLRGAVYSGDTERIVHLLRVDGPGESLQLAGEGILIAIAQQWDGVRPLTETCINALQVRSWIGDQDLVEQLETALAGVLRADFRPLPIDLEELSEAIEGDPAHSGGRLDLRTGDVWPGETWELSGVAEEEDEDNRRSGHESVEDETRWLYIWSEGSRAGYVDLIEFAESVEEQRLAELLNVALDGPGAFRRFKDVLEDWPDERDRYYRFSDERRRGRARAWLAERGYGAVPRPRG